MEALVRRYMPKLTTIPNRKTMNSRETRNPIKEFFYEQYIFIDQVRW